MHQKLIECYSDATAEDEAPNRGNEVPLHDDDVDEAPPQPAIFDDEPHRRNRDFDPNQRMSEIQIGLTARIDDEMRASALAAIERGRALSPASALAVVAEALRVHVQMNTLPPLHVLTLTGSWSELTFAGANTSEAAQTALAHVRREVRESRPRARRPEQNHAGDVLS